MSGMKVRTSITLSEDILRAVDALAGPPGTRSAFIERVLRSFVRHRELARCEAGQLAALNRHASRLNREAAEVLALQAPWSSE